MGKLLFLLSLSGMEPFPEAPQPGSPPLLLGRMASQIQTSPRQGKWYHDELLVSAIIEPQAWERALLSDAYGPPQENTAFC